jgi:hypothetical protein
MSLTNNKIKSTTIYGALNVLDMTDNSVLSSAYIKRNLTVDGNINNVPNSKFAYLTNITSDIQTQINNKSSSTDLTTTNTNITTLQTKTTDISYNSSTLTTTYGNNLIVSGNINSVPNSKFAFLTNITSDVQTQINSKSNISGNNTFTGNNTMTGSLNVNNIVLNPAGTITFPSSLPITTSTNAGLGITWNDPASGVGSGTGRTNFINYGQNATGGFTFTTLSSTATPITIMTITPTSTAGNLNLNGNFNLNNGSFIANDITSQGYFTQMYHNNQVFNIISRNDYYNGAGSPYETSINFYCYNTSKQQINPMNIYPTAINITAVTTVNGNFFCPNGNGIYGNAFQAQSVTNAVSLATNLTSGTGLTIGSSATPTNIYGSSTIVNGNLSVTGTTSGITKGMVGLGDVDNTPDLNKPISTATQTAINLKANIASPTFTGTLKATILSFVDTLSTLHTATISQTSNVLSIATSNSAVNIPASTQINFVVMTPANATNTPLILSPNAVDCNGTLYANSGAIVNGNLSASGNLTVTGNLSVTGTTTLTLGTALTLPSAVYTSSTLQLGYTILSTTASNSNVAANLDTYYNSVTVPSYGVWLITSKIAYGPASSAISAVRLSMTIVYTPIPTAIDETNYYNYYASLPVGLINFNTNPYINSQTARTFRILVSTAGGSGTYAVGASYLRATRIG